jgi:DNA primase
VPDDFAQFKEDVKNRVDIAEVIGEYVELKRRGSAILGLCPFHTEKTPSFNVNREGQFYHCFGCGKGGDVIRFLMDITGMSFMEAMEHLAERAGLEIPQKRGTDTGTRELADRVAAANLAAAEYFHRTLSAEEGKPGREYLEGRGLTQETIRAFRLGFAPEDSSGLLAFASSRGVSLDSLDSAGILMKSRYGSPPFGRFGGRVIFPIIDPAARILGFGGRILAGEGAKYVNSPETAVYHKSRVLFGLYQAKGALKKLRSAIVVEGYMDVISLHQAGVTNVLAASGTSFTIDQGRILSRLARSVILLFDGDSAGISAASRGADTLLGTDLTVTVSVLPEDHDPDSYVRANGADALRDWLGKAMDIWEFKLLALGKDSPGPEGLIRLAGEIADSIALISDELKRDVYIKELSSKLGIEREAMRKAVAGRLRRRLARREEAPPAAARIGTAGERELLAALLRTPEMAHAFMREAGAKPFTHPTLRRVADELFHRLTEGLDTSPAALMNALDDGEAQEAIAAVSVVEMDEDTAGKCISDNLRAYSIRALRTEIDDLGRKLTLETDSRKRDALQKHQNVLKTRLAALFGGQGTKQMKSR